MKRRGLMGLLFGAALSVHGQNPAKPEPAANYVRPPMGGAPVNNQCPVCSTMMPAYQAEPITDTDGKIISKPALVRHVECAYCRCVFAQMLEA
jgi:hypothetical protein